MLARDGQNSTSMRARSLLVWVAMGIFGLAAVSGAKIPAADVVVETPVYEIPGGGHHPEETWVYDFTWTGVPVGQIQIAVGPDPEKPDTALGVHVSGKTNSFIDLLWKYRLNARGSILTDPFRPGQYHSEELERTKRKITDINFDMERRVTARRQKGDKITDVAFDGTNTYDIISTVFAALSFDYVVGRVYEFDALTGSSRYLVTVEPEAQETIKVAGREFSAWRLALDSKGLTDPDDDSKHSATHIWVSAERPRRLLAARSQLYVGAVHVRLAELKPRADALHRVPSWRSAPEGSRVIAEAAEAAKSEEPETVGLEPSDSASQAQ